MAKKPRIYTPGCGDVERVMDHLADEEKRERREAFLREYHSRSNNKPKGKQEEVDNESDRQS